MTQSLIPVGIDVSKATLPVAILFPERAKPLYQSLITPKPGMPRCRRGWWSGA
jgi:hypothetical protein